MANEFVTNKRTELVLLRAAEAAPYLTVGSKSYCKDQLVGKRNGQSYEFVIRDAGEYAEGEDVTDHVSDLIERKVTKTIGIGNVTIRTSILNKVTDVNWDKEIAMPQGEKLAKNLVKSIISQDIGLQNTAFVGTGWLPLFKASNFLESISSESQYAFVDPGVESVMQATGKAFSPANGVEPIYRSGLKGTVASAEVRAQQGLPQLVISKALADELSSATVSGYVDNGDGTATLKLSNVTETIKKGTPLFVEGVYATDMVGEKTSALKAFIAIADTETAGSVKVKAFDRIGSGTKEACDADGDVIELADFGSKKLVNTIGEGTYFTGIFRVNGAFEFDTLPELDWSNAEESVTSPQGITMHTARAVNVLGGSNVTRYAIAALAGIVESRGCSYVCIKDQTANLVAM